jgi:hypothetical protein
MNLLPHVLLSLVLFIHEKRVFGSLAADVENTFNASAECSSTATGVTSSIGLRATPIENDSDNRTLFELWHDLECNAYFQYPRPIHPPEAWSNTRALYRRIMGEDSSIGTNKDDIEDTDGFYVPVTAKYTFNRGRGIFAAANITAGSLIWSTKNTARFHSGPLYRQFVNSLEEGFACDVLQWSYVQDVGNGVLRISVDLDGNSYCNDGSMEYSGPNQGCYEESALHHEGGCNEHYFALRDIDAGEELLCAYNEFAVEHGWEFFGL